MTKILKSNILKYLFFDAFTGVKDLVFGSWEILHSGSLERLKLEANSQLPWWDKIS